MTPKDKKIANRLHHNTKVCNLKTKLLKYHLSILDSNLNSAPVRPLHYHTVTISLEIFYCLEKFNLMVTVNDTRENCHMRYDCIRAMSPSIS